MRDGFDLLGDPADETRLLVHRQLGLSLPIPGHPTRVSAHPPAPPTYDVVIALDDLAVELGVRIDTLPAGGDPVALAAALTQAYAMSRSDQVRRVGALRGRLLGHGFHGGANTIYVRRDSGATPQMEHVQVVVHQTADATWAVYLTTRYASADIDVIRWAHLRSAMAGQQHWDAAAPRLVAPPLWPTTSAFAEPAARLRLTAAAQAEAEHKRDELGPLTEAEPTAPVDALIGSAPRE